MGITLKKSAALAAAAVMLIQTAYAAQINAPAPKAGDENVYTVSGSSDLGANTKLTVTVFAAGKSFADMAFDDGATDVLGYADICREGADGTFSVDWTPTASGSYDIYLAADGEIRAELKGAYVSANLKDTYAAVKSGDKAALEEIFADATKRKDILRDDALIASIKDGAALGRKVYVLREAAADKENADLYINAAANAQLLTEGGTLGALEETLSALEKIGVAPTNAKTYAEAATDAIKTDMAADFVKFKGADLAAADVFFTERLALSGIYKAANWADCEDFFNIISYPTDASKYEKAAKKVVGKKYDSIELLKKAIDAAINTAGSGNGGSSGGGGSSSSGKGGGIGSAASGSVVSSGSGANTPSSAKPMDNIFRDVDRTHYAFDDINYLRWHNVVSGDDKGNYNPSQPVTRAEAVKMLCGVFGIESAAGSSFQDVQDGEWYSGYIGGAAALGLVSGTGENFEPNAYITREDLSVMIYNFVNHSRGDEPLGGGEPSFADSDGISDYAAAAVAALSENGIINGNENGCFEPKSQADRAQTAAMLARYMRSAGIK